jgi:putative hydrolase of the HAD superfamily
MRAVFFDSGGTLARPLPGTWPKPRFRELVAAAGLPVPTDARLRAALASGRMPPVIPTLDAELAAYRRCYRTVLGELFGSFPADLPGQLAGAAVFDLDQEPYEDTLPALRRLTAAGARLAVVSNAAPSLELRHRDLGIRDFFDPFMLSAVVGSAKPDHRIYRLALDAVDLDPHDVIFVDDVPENVRAAEALGMRGYLVDRERGRGLADLEGEQ